MGRRDARRVAVSLATLLGVAGAMLASGSPALAQEPVALKQAASGQELICTPEHALGPGGGIAGTPADPAEVERLTNAATQAMILADLTGALEFLNRAIQGDPSAAEAVYLRGRILHQLDRRDEAAADFCRYLALAPAGPSSGEARERLNEALALGSGGQLREAFLNGVALHEAGRLQEAEAAFDEVLAERPAAPSALYNRALVRAARGLSGPARSDLERYLETQPPPADAVRVEQLLMRLAGGGAGPSAGAAFAAGLIPGGGQFYTGRPVFGLAVTAVAAGALGAGILYERTTIRCRDASLSSDCPEELIASRDKDRPLLLPAAGAAVGVAVIAAVEAALHARRVRRERYERPTERAGAARLELDGRVGYEAEAVRVSLLRLVF